MHENRWGYKRESRKWDIRNRIYSLLHPYSPEERILYRIRHAFHYKRRLSRKYGLHIYSSRNRQFPYFVREYDECMTEKEIARAVLYYGFSLLEDRRNALREDDSNAIYLLRDDAITYVVTYILPGNGRLRDIMYRRLLQTPSTDDGGPKNLLAFVDTNNCGEWAIPFLAGNGLAEPAGYLGMSGHCTYPLYRWNTTAFYED